MVQSLMKELFKMIGDGQAQACSRVGKLFKSRTM